MRPKCSCLTGVFPSNNQSRLLRTLQCTMPNEWHSDRLVHPLWCSVAVYVHFMLCEKLYSSLVLTAVDFICFIHLYAICFGYVLSYLFSYLLFLILIYLLFAPAVVSVAHFIYWLSFIFELCPLSWLTVVRLRKRKAFISLTDNQLHNFYTNWL